MDVQAFLYEIELELKRSVPAESAALQEASFERLRGSMLPQFSEMPVRTAPEWLRPSWGIAATILVAALGGYVVFNSQSDSLNQGDDVARLAKLNSVPVVAPTVSVAASSPTAPTFASKVLASTPMPPVEIQPVERFAISFKAPPLPASTGTFIGEPPSSEVVWSSAPRQSVASIVSGQRIVHSLEVKELNSSDSTDFTATAETIAITVYGHWLLAMAGVWEEDLRPEFRNDRLYIIGTVENEATRRRVVKALSEKAGQKELVFDLSSRGAVEAPHGGWGTFAEAGIQSSSRPGGGIVRTSLLSHFRDAARRSFQVPEPSLLEAELDLYVSRIFRGQSRLLAHAYALNAVLGSVHLEYVDKLPSETRRRLGEALGFHFSALRDEEAALYDRLSEVLPRRYWAYEADKLSEHAGADWLKEGKALLGDALRLDSTLTSLLGALPETVAVNEVHHSCGGLLRSIRNHLRHLKAPLKTLQ